MDKENIINKENNLKTEQSDDFEEELTKIDPNNISKEQVVEFIEYFSSELKNRINEINKLKQHNDALVKTSLKSSNKFDDATFRIKELEKANRILQDKVNELLQENRDLKN